ncbi:MAG: terminase family protein [Helicobacteraceae bacterium]|jgi:phage FluMu gp28-like protein/transposase-like protein|nr:terminase family protein [Helicobacteraceae bacterium]
MPKYREAIKERARVWARSGVALSEIAAELGVTASTIRRWLKAEDSTPVTIARIKKQIGELSRRKPTGANSHKIALLTNAITKLQGAEAKQRRIEAKTKDKPVTEIASADYDAIKSKAIEIGGLYNYQREFLEDRSRFRLVLKSRQIGFSYVSALDALLGAIGGRSQLFLSASEEQASILMRYLEGWAGKLHITFAKDADYEKSLNNGAYIKVMAHNFRTMQGFAGDIWLDEFAWYINPKRVWAAFAPSVTAVGGRITILSTPFEEHSLFHKLALDPDGKYYMFSRRRVDIYQAMQDGLRVADFKALRDMSDADTWASAYECQFIDDESALLPIALIKSRVKDYRLGADRTEALAAGYDIGRVKDRSVLAALAPDLPKEGEALKNLALRLKTLEALNKAAFTEQERMLSDFLKAYPLAMLKIDKTGIGMATAEKLQNQYGRRVEGVYFTSATKEALSLNLKKHFEDGTITIPNDPALIADLHAIKRKAGAKGFLYDADRNASGHADRFWALALAASHYEVARSPRRGRAWIIQ